MSVTLKKLRKEITKNQADDFQQAIVDDIGFDADLSGYLSVNVVSEAGKFYYEYLEVESTGLPLPWVNTNEILWLDCEGGYVYKSVSATPVFNPLFNIKWLVEKEGFDWEVFLNNLIKFFNPSKGIGIVESMDEKQLRRNFVFNPDKSLTYNFIAIYGASINKPLEAKNGSKLRDTINASILSLINIDSVLSKIDPLRIVSFIQYKPRVVASQATNSHFADFLVLENSFQSPILKDFMGALSVGMSADKIVEKAAKSNIFATFNTVPSVGTVGPEVLKQYFSDVSRFREGELPQDSFPYEVVTDQLAKIVRRFKIKGII